MLQTFKAIYIEVIRYITIIILFFASHRQTVVRESGAEPACGHGERAVRDLGGCSGQPQTHHVHVDARWLAVEQWCRRYSDTRSRLDVECYEARAQRRRHLHLRSHERRGHDFLSVEFDRSM